MSEPQVGALYPTRSAGEALVTGRVEWPLRNGTSVSFLTGVLMRDGATATWEPDGHFEAGRNDPWDIILT